jgi:signal transduction histidine kinase/ActR/RegA family two-component response regulator
MFTDNLVICKVDCCDKVSFFSALERLGNKNRLLKLLLLVGIGACFFVPVSVFASDTKDSLEQIIANSTKVEEKIDAHYQLALYFANSESPEVILHAYKAREMSLNAGYSFGLARADFLLAQVCFTTLNQDSLEALLLESSQNFELAARPEYKAKAINQLGILYERQGKYRLALKCYYEALFVFQQINDEVGIANEKNNIGLIHQLQRRYKMAIYFFNQAMAIGNKIHNDDILANAYNNLAICYQEQHQPQKALDYFYRVYEIDQKQGISENLALSYNNLGVIETDLGNYQEAKSYLYKSLEAKRKVSDFTGISNTYNNFANVFIKTKQLDSALYFAQLAVKDAKTEHAFPYLADAYDVLGKLMELKGDYANALQYQKLRLQLKDSLTEVENSLIFNQQESDFQSLLKEKADAEEKSEEEKSSLKRILYFLGLTLVLMLVTFMVYYVFRVRSAYKHLQVKQKKIEVQNKILQVKNIEVLQAKEAAEDAAGVKSQFISTISHEIRTPLNAIIGVTNLLHSGNPREEQIDNLNILKISSENLLQLVNNILDFSKLEAGKLQLENIEFNLRNLVFDVKELFTIKALEKGVELMVEYDEKIPSVLKGDPLRLNQLLINLVNNAIKFTDSGYVKIEVSVQLSTINHALVYFQVIDTGIGIPVSKQSQIFNSFTQADPNTTRKFGGTGLGLSICKRILENLNSKLQIESEVGKGSRFYFTLNLEVSRNASLGKSAKTASFEDSIKGKRVLVVEDNMMNIMVIRQFLQKWGVITEIALNGREGLNRLMESNFDAILMDIHMPEMDGIEATTLIRKLPDERKRNVPIIALTAENEMQFRQKVYEVGMNDYIFKPFNPDDLRERLGYALYNKANGINKYTRQD